MRKIPTLYLRDPDTNLRYVKEEVHPDCHWVIAGEGRATYKWDGTAVLIDLFGQLWKRRQVKPGKEAPPGYREMELDPETGKSFGWEPVDYEAPENQLLVETFRAQDDPLPWGKTYELVGPKVNRNPHQLPEHHLVQHGQHIIAGRTPVDYGPLAEWTRGFLESGVWVGNYTVHLEHGFEGIVWWHSDGRKAKIKAKDFPMPELQS